MRKKIGALVIMSLCCFSLNAKECSKEQIARMIKEGYTYDDILVWLKSELKKRDIELDAELTRASLYQWIRRSISDKDIEQAVVTDDEVAVAKKTTDSKVSIFKNLIK